MSRLRSLLSVAALLPLCAWSPSQSSPAGGNENRRENAAKQSAAQTEATATDSTKLEIIKAPQPIYPLQAERDEIQGQVWVQLLISEKGNVENVHVISGDPVLAKAASDAVRKWKFKPFVKDGKPIKVTTSLPFDFFFRGKVIEKGASRDQTAVVNKNTNEASGPLPRPATESSTTSNAQAVFQPVAVAAGVSKGLLVRRVAPVYPADARRRRVQGDVVLQAVIGKDGRVTSIIPLSGPAELVSAAVGAVQQWRYKPYMLNNQPVEVKTYITVRLRLSR